MRALGVFILSAVVVMACSNGNGNADGGTDASPSDSSTDASSDSPSVTAMQACSDEANAVCALRDKCSPSYNVTVVYGSDSVCQSRTTQSCVDALSANGQANTPARTEMCAAAYPGESCADFFDTNPAAACVPPTGTLPNGAACGASGQCMSTFCATGATAVCGKCQPLPAVGASCQIDADCGRNLACATPTVAGDAGLPAPKCAAWVASGGTCLTGYQPCQTGLSCVGDDEATMTTGTCQAAVTMLNSACDGSRKTMPSCNADMGLVCIPTAKGSAVGTCQNIQLAAPNAPCGDIGSAPITGFAVCQTGLCKKASVTATTGTCVADAADGVACDNDPTIGPSCLTPAKCVVSGSGTAGTCTFPNASTCM
jgi:hypothetical protein